ncbi:MAG: hypothetical protein MZV65_18895 [Chromatiales bacterium]|nr:hypothetical protein [Chromatiales bacterium]
MLVPFSAGEMHALVDDVARRTPRSCRGARRRTSSPRATRRQDRAHRHRLSRRPGPLHHGQPRDAAGLDRRHAERRPRSGTCTASGASRALAPDACKIEFELAYEFSTHLLEPARRPGVRRTSLRASIDAFVRRAEARHAT